MKKPLFRIIAIKLVAALFAQIAFPTAIWALTGGPSQPEVESFEPIGTSEMVDLFSGDFTYNIPLLDVEGYPVNLSYHSGISMDQEASWTGLGWNVNVGSINRGLRGLPDDFKGEPVQKWVSMKNNNTFGLTGAATFQTEVIGKKIPLGGSLSLSAGIKYNNYTGWGTTIAITPGINAGINGSFGLNASLGLSLSSDEGSSIQPSVGVDYMQDSETKKAGKGTSTLGMSFGGSFNSRSGLNNLTLSATASSSKGARDKAEKKKGKEKTPWKIKKDSNPSGGGSIGAAWEFGQQSYSPNAQLDFNNWSLTGTFTAGPEFVTIHPGISLTGYVSRQKLKSTYRETPAYGYMHSQSASGSRVLYDFNRENDGAFTSSTPTLPVCSFTYDIFSVSGQGVGGSYRPFRSDFGTVHDAEYANDPDDNYSLEIELGAGGVAKFGGSIGFSRVNAKAGNWSDGNQTASTFDFDGASPGNLKEAVFFKEANEKNVDANPGVFGQVYHGQAVRPVIEGGKFDHVAKKIWRDETGNTHNFGDFSKPKREKRGQLFSYLTRSEAIQYGVEDHYTTAAPDAPSAGAQPHHIAEVSVTSVDGARYVYGLPAYNTKQEEYTFAVGKSVADDSQVSQQNYGTGLFQYTSEEKSDGNQMGIDNFYSKTATPAYAHSYLLTCVLSSDYVDSDGVRGPSEDDFGNYTKFSYSKVANYPWRMPYQDYYANYNEGLKCNQHDDQASLTYGEKDLFYLDKIETKNYVAIFNVTDRSDALSANVLDSGTGSIRSKKLESISLYNKADYDANGANAIPIKTVHFVYSYELCPGIPNFSSMGPTETGLVDINNDGISTENQSSAKLSLKEVYFTYGNSEKARFSSYKFNYASGNLNPAYNVKGYDRWGNYKPNTMPNVMGSYPQGLNGPDGLPVDWLGTDSNNEKPYTPQDKTIADQYAQSWHLNSIQLPSGGKILIEYESDDYSSVQHKPTMQMLEIVGTGVKMNGEPVLEDYSNNYGDLPISKNEVEFTDLINVEAEANESETNRCIFFKLAKDENGDPITDMNLYKQGIKDAFIKSLVKFRRKADENYGIPGIEEPMYEYVPGYYEVKNVGYRSGGGLSSEPLGWVELKPIGLNDNNGNAKFSPITKNALQFARLNLTKEVYNASDMDDDNQLKAALLSICDAIGSIKELFSGPNRLLYYQQQAKYIVANKSMIRLNVPGKTKYGGGSRVKKIKISDQWQNEGIVDGEDHADNFEYGQEYDYTDGNGVSSGVASYEPQIGGEENPWKQPIPYGQEKKMIPDERFYQEEPVGEMFFPGASVGYAKVTVRSLSYENVTRHATGKVVHEFYTAKDFPTLVSRTDVGIKHGKDGPGSIRSLLKINVRDYMTASQGFSIELNDMHGKPKKIENYSEGAEMPFSSVEYKYKSAGVAADGIAANQLVNECTVIKPDGSLQENARLGVYYDVMNDARESNFKSMSFELKGNLDVTPFFGISIPTIWPSKNIEKTRFRSITTTKVVQRFGILDETIAVQDGSQVSTKTIAYDSETGQPLLTETVTDYDDKIYTLTYPAYWHYREMGPAYTNIGFSNHLVFDPSGKAPVADALKYYAVGDELAIYPSNALINKAWITEVQPT
ncbi:MAG: hypothetical protein ACKVOK_12600 [Flavobacteriales bacterium]